MENIIKNKRIKKIIKELYPEKINWEIEDISIQYFKDTHLFYFDELADKTVNPKITKGEGFYVNEFELLYKLKEWLCEHGYEAVSGKSKVLVKWGCDYFVENENDYNNYVCILNFRDSENGAGYTGIGLDFEVGFMGKTELKSILQAIEFVLKNKS